MGFKVKITKYPAKHLAGMKVRTNMQKSTEDCPKLWGTFMTRMHEIKGQPVESFGVSEIIDDTDFDTFDYWAALELLGNTPLPEGMGTVDIKPGTYARCIVPKIEKLGEAYMYLYKDWLKANPQYVPNIKHNCFELYPGNWNPGVGLDIYMPIQKA